MIGLVTRRVFVLLAFVCLPMFSRASADDDIRGLYRAVLLHEGTDFYQYANITLRTMNIGGQLKVSANVKVLFGDWNSNEYLTYEFPDVPLNLLTRQLNMRDDANDVSLVGTLRSGVLEGEWFSSMVGRVGAFKAQKTGVPADPANGTLVRTLSGYYRGTLTNTNPQSNLPERISMSFVTTQEASPDGPVIRVTGNVRFYLGGFDSPEYVETKFNNIQFNFFNRFMTAKTEDYGLTFKGTMAVDGSFEGIVLSDGLGEVGDVEVKSYP